MDQNLRKPDALQRNLRVLNQKEDRNLQQKLAMLEKQYKYSHKMLQQRTDSLMKEQRRVVMVKVCEPKATVNLAMKEIGEHQKAETHFRDIQTSEGRRFLSRKSPNHNEGSKQVEPSRSISAPPQTVKPAGTVRHRGGIQCSVSLMQMKKIATIDSISEKELTKQQQRAWEEMERLRQLQRETLHNRVAAFIEKLQDKSNMQSHMDPS